MLAQVDVPQDEVVVKLSRSGGPGGQHANTSETRVELAWDVASSAAPTDAQRAVLIERLGPVVRAVAEDSRSQARNKDLAFERLAAKVAAALVVARPRRKTRPSRGAVERRLEAKRHISERKRGRRSEPED
ncbi:MAG: alternative ribosome rescue aminoacyl-tRNA hydrolase ArfB [Acidimicrobiales bacterium]